MINLKNKKILITGASGFVGSNAVHFFSEIGANVTAVVSPKATKKIIERQLGTIKKRISIKKFDLISPLDAVHATKKQDIILHFAAVDGNAEFKKNHSAEIFSKNVRITLNMLEASVKSNAKTFLLMSSADIYTPSNRRLITENSPIDINWNRNIDGYKLAKWSCELAAKEFSKQYKLNVIVLRSSNLYGPRDEFRNKERMRLIPTIIKKIFETQEPIVLWGSKTQLRSFLYINDFLKICMQIIEKEIYDRPVNIASNQNITLEDLTSKIIALAQKKHKVIIDKNKSPGYSSRKFSLSLLKQLFPGFEENRLSEGIKTTIEFYKKNYLKK